jgi:uncharacterized membrane protein
MGTLLSKTSRQALGLGAVAGMRAMAAPAILSHFLSQSKDNQLGDSSLHYLQNSKVATGMKFLSAAELITDKLPRTPDRISAPQLLVRIVSGAVVGATISQANGERKLTGALLGGIGAVMASYAFFYLRKKLSQATPLPDAAFAIAEDALTVWAGAALAKS